MSDWIKMRSSLLTNPKVVRMARELLRNPEFTAWMCPGACVTSDETVTKPLLPVVTRIVVGALLPTWSAVNDTAARDGIVRHASSRDIDETAGVPGFGAALIAVGWLEEMADGTGVMFVNFEEHNQPQKERALTAKTGAERQKEYRDRKKREAEQAAARDAMRDGIRYGDSDVTSDVTRDGREEKKRVEKKKGAKAPSSAGKLPPCPHRAIVDLYHEVLPELPAVRTLKEPRKRLIAGTWGWVLTSTRLSDGARRATTSEEALQWFRHYFTRARSNDFLMGRTPRKGEHANWSCDLDFLLTDKGMKHVIEKTIVTEEAEEVTA